MAAERQRDADKTDNAVAEAVLDDMRSTGRLVSPPHFEFWFTYKTGRNAGLNAAVDELIGLHGKISAAQVERLFAEHVSPWRLSDGCDAVTSRLSEQLRALSTSIEEAIESSSAQRENLMAEASELAVVGTVTLRRAIQSVERLMQSAKDGRARHAILEAKLDATRREIGALQKQLEIVRVESQVEPVTSLIGRAAFDRALAKAADKAVRDGEPLALILVDVDYFSNFNANFGRAIGDQALRAIGFLLKTHLRAADLVARFGGDEFAAILPNARIDQAVQLADRFRQVLMTNELAQSSTGSVSGRLTLSVGVAGHVQGDDAETLLKRTRAGLTVAKKEGRNRVVEMKPEGPVWTASRVA